MEEDKKYNIFLSDKAIEAIKLQLEKHQNPNAFLRLGIKGGACEGFIYVIQIEDKKLKDKDLIFKFDNLQVVIDHKSINYLNNSTLDWENTLMFQGFKFHNPNEKSNCSCGLSVSF